MQTVVIDEKTVTGIGGRINRYVEQPALNKLGFTYDNKTGTLVAPEGWSFESAGYDHDAGVIRHGDVVRGEWGCLGPLKLLRRHKITSEQPDCFDGHVWYKSMVMDVLTGEIISPVFTATASQVRYPGDDWLHHKAENDAHAWLMEHFPETHDPTAYWGD